MRKIDYYSELAAEETLEVSTECYNTKSCAACSKRKGCLNADTSEKRKVYKWLNNENKIVPPPKRILQRIHADTEGRGYNFDDVIQITEDGKKHIISENVDNLYAVSYDLILPNIYSEYFTESNSERLEIELSM